VTSRQPGSAEPPPQQRRVKIRRFCESRLRPRQPALLMAPAGVLAVVFVICTGPRCGPGAKARCQRSGGDDQLRGFARAGIITTCAARLTSTVVAWMRWATKRSLAVPMSQCATCSSRQRRVLAIALNETDLPARGGSTRSSLLLLLLEQASRRNWFRRGAAPAPALLVVVQPAALAVWPALRLCAIAVVMDAPGFSAFADDNGDGVEVPDGRGRARRRRP
jgi:hypothetical protein